MNILRDSGQWSAPPAAATEDGLFDARYAEVIKGGGVAPRAPRQRCATAAERLTTGEQRAQGVVLV
ncbi:hypothetical protein [Streptomyces sp. NBC_00691]|uniref:hypothetical protein n=1 Tax=Streptomyces sp. NBC_00691 TaxID=2903671 RepID=UPI002E37B077|nr:hypothetical protein [Streptomyces sp. NBC_00691]